jgi:uncharacterized membrane protein
MKKWLLAFLAGFVATLVFHQGALWLLHQAGMTPRTPFAMRPVPPFNVPSVISLAFWGGVWGIIMIALIGKTRAFYFVATVFGAVLPTLVAAFVIAPLRHMPLTGSPGKLLAVGLIVNGAWGLGTAVLYRLFMGGRR